MISRLLLTTFFISLVAFCHGNLLKNRLLSSKSGDFIVVEQNKITSILSVHSKEKNRLVLEEISIPSHMATRITDWKAWVDKAAPHHSSWVMYEIDTKTDEVLECFSFSKSGWLKLSDQDYWLACLFKIPLKQIPSQDRRKIGPAPMGGEKDYRKIWNPSVRFEGKDRSIPSTAYQGNWPDDGTELAKKRFTLYFDEKKLSPFPCWIQVSNPHITFNVRIIDGGKNLKSPYKSLPKRPPEILRVTKNIKQGYRLYIDSPKYFEEYLLYVRDISEPHKTLTRVSFTSSKKEGQLIIDIPFSSLAGHLQNVHLYSWVITPKCTPSIHTESKEPFLWKDLE